MIRIVTSACLMMFVPLAAFAQDWPQFRGPDGQGLSDVQVVPLKWSETSDNIAWTTPVEGLGWSSPAIRNGRAWMTASRDEGQSLHAVCINVEDGAIVHDLAIFEDVSPGRIHTKNSHASPTPIIDGDRVYVHFGAYGTACLTDAGRIVWRQSVEYQMVHGPGGSPVLYENLLIVNCDGRDLQFVVAFDKQTGQIKWKTPRPQNGNARKFAFSTPLVVDVNGRDQLISPAAGTVAAIDPRNGKPIWRFNYPGGYSVVPRPVYGHGLVFVSSSYNKASLFAIRVGGRGDVTESHLAWKLDRGAPHNPSPLLIGDELYLVSDNGIATCVDAKTGDVHWQERLGGNYSASPLYAAGRVYFLDENGTTTVVASGRSFKQLAKNRISGRTLASLVPVEGAILLRTDSKLYRVDAES